jgi:tetratricopeptide (TPR) repeat protein
MSRPSAPLLAGLLLLPLGARAEGNCTRENVVAAERRCYDVHRAGRSKSLCGEALGAMLAECQRDFRRRGQVYPPAPADNPARLLRSIRHRYLDSREGDIAADSDGVPAIGSSDYVAPGAVIVRDTPRQEEGGDTTAEALQPPPAGPQWSDILAFQQQLLTESERPEQPRRGEPAPAGLVAGGQDTARGILSGLGAVQHGNPLGLQAAANALAADPGRFNLDVAVAQRVLSAPKPKSEDLLFAGGLLLAYQRAPQAEQAFSRVLRSRPDYAPAYRLRAYSRLASGDADGAAQDARALAKLQPDDAEAKRILGQAKELAQGAARVNRMNIGFGAAQDAPDIDGGAGPGAVAAGGAPGATREPGAAELSGEELERAAAAGIVLPTGGAGLRDAPPSTRRWLEGLAPGPEPFAALPPMTQRLWLSALENAAIGRWKPALEDASLLIQAAPEDGGPWLLRSKVLGKLRNWKAAESDARKALEKSPEDPAALLELGYAQLQQGRAEEGLATIDRALALRPGSGLGHLYRAEALEKLGRIQDAVAEYRLAASFDPVLRPLTQDALRRLEPRDAEKEEKRPRQLPPWRRTLLLVAGLIGALLALKAAQQFGVFGGGERHEAAETALAARAAGPAEHRPGDVIGGHFTVEKELARGGMGVVYLATDTMLKRSVAIKRLNEQAYGSEDARRKFIQEAQLAARLKHPNLAQIHSVFGERELYLVFEYVEGQGLDAALAARGRLGLAETREIVRQVCAGLSHAHEGRVIHRDLKPANVMLGADGTAKILDFGIAHEARTVSNATLTQAWGTPPYMAPEQEDGYVSPASDLYALGVMAYELLAGQRPFEGANQLGLKRSGSFAKLGGRHGLPAEADRFFARALHPDPAQRFARASDFVNAFDELAGTPVRS